GWARSAAAEPAPTTVRGPTAAVRRTAATGWARPTPARPANPLLFDDRVHHLPLRRRQPQGFDDVAAAKDEGPALLPCDLLQTLALGRFEACLQRFFKRTQQRRKAAEFVLASIARLKSTAGALLVDL